MLAYMKEAFRAFERRLEEDQAQLETLKQEGLARGLIPYEERKQ